MMEQNWFDLHGSCLNCLMIWSNTTVVNKQGCWTKPCRLASFTLAEWHICSFYTNYRPLNYHNDKSSIYELSWNPLRPRVELVHNISKTWSCGSLRQWHASYLLITINHTYILSCQLVLVCWSFFCTTNYSEPMQQPVYINLHEESVFQQTHYSSVTLLNHTHPSTVLAQPYKQALRLSHIA